METRSPVSYILCFVWLQYHVRLSLVSKLSSFICYFVNRQTHALYFDRIFEQANLWIGGDAILDYNPFHVHGEVNVYFAMPSLTSVSKLSLFKDGVLSFIVLYT